MDDVSLAIVWHSLIFKSCIVFIVSNDKDIYREGGRRMYISEQRKAQDQMVSLKKTTKHIKKN